MPSNQPYMPRLTATKQRATAFAMITLGIGELVTSCALMFKSFFGGEGGVSTNRVVGTSLFSLNYGPSIQVYYLIIAWTVIAIALAGVRFSTAGIRLLAERFCAVGLPGIGTPLAVALVTVALAGKPALGEFLLRPPRRSRAALAAGGPIAPAAGIVVFVVIAGHECSLGSK